MLRVLLVVSLLVDLSLDTRLHCMLKQILMTTSTLDLDVVISLQGGQRDVRLLGAESEQRLALHRIG
jgi:hypothetical protein